MDDIQEVVEDEGTMDWRVDVMKYGVFHIL